MSDILSVVSPFFDYNCPQKWLWPTTRFKDEPRYTQSLFDSIYETIEGDLLKLSCDLPGVDKNDIEIDLKNEVITIKAKRLDRQNTTYKFMHTIPKEFDATSAEAEMKNGVLNLTIKRSESSKPVKIRIK